MTSKDTINDSDKFLLIASLRIPDQQTQNDLVPIYVSAFKIFHHRMDLETMEDDSHFLHQGTVQVPLSFNIPINQVVKRKEEEEEEGSSSSQDVIIFDGLAYQ